MYSIYCARRSVQCAVLNVQFSVCRVQCVVCIVQYAVCSVRHVICSKQYAVYSVQFDVCQLKCTVCNDQCAWVNATVNLLSVQHCSTWPTDATSDTSPETRHGSHLGRDPPVITKPHCKIYAFAKPPLCNAKYF